PLYYIRILYPYYNDHIDNVKYVSLKLLDEYNQSQTVHADNLLCQFDQLWESVLVKFLESALKSAFSAFESYSSFLLRSCLFQIKSHQLTNVIDRFQINVIDNYIRSFQIFLYYE